MADFLKQINEDIEDYQEKYPYISNIAKPEWAFNFWVLDKLYSQDEQLIEEQIVEYNDKGIDCFVWHEDSLDLYLIQNKYYTDNTTLTVDYIQNDFLVRAIGALRNGTYTRSPELQQIFTKFCDEPDFTVHFRLYVTNNVAITPSIVSAITEYNLKHEGSDARVYSLDEIETLYYGEPIQEKKNLSFDIRTINNGTVLNINTKSYNLAQNLDAKYVFTPILSLYELMEKAKKEKYPLFDDNIRDYLGASTVNKGIVATLKDSVDRVNFFYYNNGITIIVKKMQPVKTLTNGAVIPIFNPQIVNGCQTVSTIYETLKGYPTSSLEAEFKDCYVMCKILEIKDDTDQMEMLNENIVRYNNSQNAINQKTFAASAGEFVRIQREFERKGFLVCIKQSDKHTFEEKYKVASRLLALNAESVSRFGLTNLSKTKDFFIDLEKFLQVVVAFASTTIDAIQKKSKLLRPDSLQHATVLGFIKGKASINDMLDLYLLYLRAEQIKNKSDLKLNPFFLINCFSRYECESANVDLIHEKLATPEKVNVIVRLYQATLRAYYIEWIDGNPGKDYNDMIKTAPDFSIIDKQRRIQVMSLQV